MLLPDLPVENRGTAHAETPKQQSETVNEASAVPRLAAKGGSASGFKQTMIGLAPLAVDIRPNDPVPGAASDRAPVAQPDALAPARPARAMFQTMLGLAPAAPAAAPTNQAKQTLLGAGNFSVPEIGKPLPFGSKKETLIGVAIPGIAPVNPGVHKIPSASSSDERAEIPDPQYEPGEPSSDMPLPSTRTTRRYLALYLSIAAGVLATISVIAIGWWRSSPKLDVQVRTDDSGRDSLELDCTNCDDGSTISLEESSTTFGNHHASIPLKVPMKMGDNWVQLVLSRHSARAETIRLRVPVDYRVVGNMSALNESPPRLRLLVEKSPNVVMDVEGQPVSFDATGHGHYDIDVSEDLIGQANLEKPLERRVSYSVRNATVARRGSVLLRTGILPLLVNSPGALFITDREEFKLCGITSSIAQVDIAGLNVGVDSSGHFCHLMVIKENGRFAIWITASARGYAPRRVQRIIERTSNLGAYARKLYGEVTHEFEKAEPTSQSNPNSLVALTGTIIELSESPPVTRLLLQYGSKRENRGFVRVVASNQPPLVAGRMVTVFGQIAGTLKGPDGREMNELSAAFIILGVP
jgi:hypothetical protein